MATDRLGRSIKSGAGVIYVNTDTATDDTARRFTTSRLYLEDVVIVVEDAGQSFGDSSSQTYPVGEGDTVGFGHVDLSTLYFKNTTPGDNGTVNILGVQD